MSAMALPLTRPPVARSSRDTLDIRVHQVLDQFAGPALLLTQHTGRVLACNTGAMRALGYTRAELLARSLAELLPSAEASAWLGLFDTLEIGQNRQVLGMPHLTPTQQVVWIDWRLTAWREGSQTIILAQGALAADRLAHDEQHRQLEHLVQLHHELTGWLASLNLPSTLVLLDLVRAGYGADAAAVFTRPASAPYWTLAETCDWPASAPRQIASGRWEATHQTFHWVTGQRLEGRWLRVFRQAGWQQVFTQPLGETNLLMLGYASARPLPHAAAFLPLTAQHWLAHQHHQRHLVETRTLRTALESRAAQWHVLHTHTLPAVITLDAHGQVNDLNPAASALLGYQPAEVTGLPIAAVLNPDEATTRFLRQAQNDNLAGDQRGQVHRRNGDMLEADLHTEPLPDGGLMVLVHDLSQARHEQLRREQLDHLAYVGQSTQAFAHEVRAPLNNIAMGMQFLDARLPADEAMRAHFGKIQTECQRLSDLMNDMLAWTKPVNPNFNEIDLNALLKRLLQRWGNKLTQRHIQLNFTPAPALPGVLADASLLERIFVNLIENALHAMPQGGDLSVSLGALETAPGDTVVQVKVGDSGPGIPEETRKRIFDPYFTTRKDGTGLGLAICKRLVTIHHGAIAVESYPGVGSIFTVTLPAQTATHP